MNKQNLKIGIIVPVIDIPDVEINRWSELIVGYTDKYNLVPLMITKQDGNFFNEGVFSKSKALNFGVAKLFNKCDIIIQTDIDCLFPPELLDRTINETTNDNFIYCKVRRVKKYHLDWEVHKKDPISHGEGGWNAAVPSMWKRIGGWWEDIAGRGTEDIDLHWRIRKFKIPMVVINDIPLVHIPHSKPRKWWDGGREKRNHQRIFKKWKEWEKDLSQIPNSLKTYL